MGERWNVVVALSFALPMALPFALLGACSTAPPVHATSLPASAPSLADDEAQFATRLATRRAEELQQLIALDRLGLEVAERMARDQRSLFEAGRVQHVDVQTADAEVLASRARLAQREGELAAVIAGKN